jgi:hypothetical protein
MLGRYPRRVRAVEVEQLLAEYRQPEVVICFRRPLHLTTSLYRRLDTESSAPYHHLAPRWWVEVWLYGRLWIKSFICDRIPALVLFFVDEALLL